MDAAQLAKFLDVVRERSTEWWPLFHVMACSGIRIGAQALLWEDVNFNAATFHVHRNQTRSGLVDDHAKTKSGTRTVELPQVAIETWRDLRSRATLPLGRVFFDELTTRREVNSANHRINRAFKAPRRKRGSTLHCRFTPSGTRGRRSS